MRASDKTEKHILRLNRLYAFLSQVNQTIVHAQNEEELFRDICKVAISHGRFRMAWVGLVDKPESSVTPVAWDGIEDGYLSAIPKLSGNNVLEGTESTAIAIRNKSVSYINDIENDPATALWRNEAIKRGYRSSCSLPLILNDQVMGVFNIYASEPHFFDENELKRLQEIAGDISFGLDRFEKERQRDAARLAHQASESRYRELLEDINLLAILLDLNGKVTFCNPFLLSLTGYTSDEITGCDWFDKMLPDTDSDTKKMFLTALKSAQIPKYFENPIVTKSGELLDISWSNTLLRDSSGTIIGAASIGEDITERKLVEKKEKEYAHNLANILESVSDAFVSLDTNWCYTYMNKKAGEIFGRNPQEMIGKHIWTEFPEGVGQVFYHTYYKAVETQEFQFLEEYYPPYDLWFENRIYPSEEGLSIFFHDISDRKRAEIALNESEVFNRLLIDQLPIGLAMTTMDGSLVNVNSAFCKMMGRTYEETLQLSYWDITPQLYQNQEQEQLNSLAATGHYGPYEKEYIHKDGYLVPVRLQGLSIERKGEKLIWSSVEDITERKMSEKALFESTHLLQNLIDNSQSVIYVFDGEGKCVLANRKLESLFNIPKEKYIGRSRTEFMPKEAAGQQRKNDQLVINSKQAMSFEEEIVDDEGKHFFLTEKFPLTDVLGNIYAVGGVSTDITERKLSELAIKSERDFSQALLDGLPGIYYLFDQNLHFIRWNKNFETFSGYSGEEIAGMLPLDFFHLDEKELLKERIGKVFTNGYADVEANFLTKDGKRIPYYFNGLKIVFNNQDCLTGIGIDITDRVIAEETLQKNEKVLRLFVEHAPASIAMFDREMNYIVASHRYLTDYDLGNQDVVGRSHYEIFPEMPERWKKIHLRCLSGEIEKSEADPFPRASGNLDWIKWEIHPWYQQNDEIGGIILFSEVITERMKAEATLRESEEKYRSIYENSNVGILFTTVDGKILSANEFACKIFDRTEVEICTVGRNGLIDVTDPQLAILLEERKKIGRAKGELWFIKKDGTTFPGEISSVIFKDKEGNERTSMIISDLTEQKQAEEEILTTSEELKTINKIILASTSTLNLTELLDKILSEVLQLIKLEGGTICLLEPDDTLKIITHREASEATLNDLEQKKIKVGDCLCGNCAQDNCPLILYDRQEVLEYTTREAQRGEDIRFHAAFPFTSKEKCLGVLCVFTRTDKKPDDRSLKLLETLTAQVSLALENAMLVERLEHRVIERTEQLQAANKELETFTYSVSHDLKAPLRGIDGYSKLLNDLYGQDLNDEAKKFVTTIRSLTQQMNQLIEDLLQYSRLERSQKRTEKVKIKPIIDSILKINQDDLLVDRFIVENNVPDIIIQADSAGIQIVLRNVIGNAIKFTRSVPQPTVKFTLDETPSSWVLSVEDNGVGFDMKYSQRIFEIFQRLHRIEDYPGTGIGLAMVSKAMQRMNGRVWAESSPGQGAKIYLEFQKTFK